MTTAPTTRLAPVDMLAGIGINMKRRIVACWRDCAAIDGIDALPQDPAPGEVMSLTYKYTEAAILDRVRRNKLTTEQAKALRAGRGIEIICGPSGHWLPKSCDCESQWYKSGLEYVEDGPYHKEACKHHLLCAMIANTLHNVLANYETDVKAYDRKERAERAKGAKERREQRKRDRLGAKKESHG